MTQEKIVEKAPAKVNLYLEVTGRRPNGYHDLDSLVVFADVGETLSAQSADEISLEIKGPWAGALDAESDNLILKAARLLKKKTGLKSGVKFELDKHIPVAAGVGGGSADAAAALRALNRLWQLSLSEDDLCALGLELGADVPVCVRSRTSRFQGIGDILSEGPEIPLSLGLILVNPRLAVSTKDVFAKVQPALNRDISQPQSLKSFIELHDWLRTRRNDLERPAKELAGDIASCLDALKQEVEHGYVAMSGSGATCFALCENAAIAKVGSAALHARQPNWWTWGGKII